MRGFRNFVQNTYRHVSNGFGHARNFAIAVDRGIGKAARLYSTIAPIVAPMAREALGGQAAEAVNQSINSAMVSYGNVRGRVAAADQMGRSLHAAVRKEIPGIM